MLSSTRIALAACLLTFAAGASGCGDDGSNSGGDEFTLSDGTVVRVSERGTLSIHRDDREIFGLAEGSPLAVHRFTETNNGGLGLWTFDRSDETIATSDTITAVERDGEVVIEATAADASLVLRVIVGVERPGSATRLRFESEVPSDAASVSVPLRCDEASTFFGFGEQYNAADQRGEAFEVWVTEQGIGRDPAQERLPFNGDAHTTYFAMPYYLDARGFGGLFRTERRVDVDLCKSDPAVARFEIVDPEPFELVVFGGPTVPDVLEQLGEEVGRPKAPPAWAYDVWIGAQGGQTDVLAEVDALAAAEIPFGVLWVQDWTGVRMNFDGGTGVQYRWRADTELYPDLAALTTELHARGIRFLGYANPFIDPNLDHYATMAAEGWLIRNADGEPYQHIAPNGLASHPDLSDPRAATYVIGELSAMVTELGMDGWMADFGEWIPLDAVVDDGTDPMVFHNRFPVLWQAVQREVMDAVRPDGDWVVFARSGFTGVQRRSMIYWAGDQEATFSPHDGLPTVVPALVNLGLSGVPFVTHDIAGFSGGPSSKELFLRWTELGAFTPIMRTHEGAFEDDNWSWETDEETTAHFRRFARIHDALVPEIMGWASAAAERSLPIVRHLMLEFPDDPRARTIDDAFMLGDTYLVAPVVDAGVTAREVYLPAGTWFHVWTGSAHEGPDTITIDAPIGSPPVFSRDTDKPELRAITD